LGCGLRIGELVALRWPNVDLVRKRAIIAEFSTTLGYLVVPSSGKSPRRRGRWTSMRGS